MEQEKDTVESLMKVMLLDLFSPHMMNRVYPTIDEEFGTEDNDEDPVSIILGYIAATFHLLGRLGVINREAIETTIRECLDETVELSIALTKEKGTDVETKLEVIEQYRQRYDVVFAILDENKNIDPANDIRKTLDKMQSDALLKLQANNLCLKPDALEAIRRLVDCSCQYVNDEDGPIPPMFERLELAVKAYEQAMSYST